MALRGVAEGLREGRADIIVAAGEGPAGGVGLGQRQQVGEGVEIVVLQGERPMSKDNKKLGTFHLDGGDHIEHLCDGLTDAEASRLLQLPSGGLSYWVAAIRECFEEAGVLLARHAATGEPVRFDDPVVAERFNGYRHRVHEGELGLHELCDIESLRLATDAIRYVSHWITPKGEVRRFDTRFFLARAPQAQDPLHDDGETIESLWVSPTDALDRFKRGELAMIPPTIRNLEFLVPHRTADLALEAAMQVGIPPAILPRLRIDDEGKVIAVVMPDEPGYEALD